MADILVVDDDHDLAAALAEVLAEAGHTVRVAYDGWGGLAALNERLPELVLLDIEMPALNGPGMAHQMLVLDVGRDKIPILLLSAFVGLPAVARRVGTPYSAPKRCELLGAGPSSGSRFPARTDAAYLGKEGSRCETFVSASGEGHADRATPTYCG